MKLSGSSNFQIKPENIAIKKAIATNGNDPPRRNVCPSLGVMSFDIAYNPVPAMFPTIPPILPNVCRNPIVPPSDDSFVGDDADELTIRLRFDFRLGSRK
jgi:hypothetical protein